MWIVCITSVRYVLTVNGYGGRQTKENEKSWCFKGWETLVNNNRKSALRRFEGYKKTEKTFLSIDYARILKVRANAQRMLDMICLY